MKNARQISKNDVIDNRLKMSNHQGAVPKSKLACGSVVGLYPVILDGGRTTIYISDLSKEEETRKKYALRMGN
jgi:hypothetical protein